MMVIGPQPSILSRHIGMRPHRDKPTDNHLEFPDQYMLSCDVAQSPLLGDPHRLVILRIPNYPISHFRGQHLSVKGGRVAAGPGFLSESARDLCTRGRAPAAIVPRTGHGNDAKVEKGWHLKMGKENHLLHENCHLGSHHVWTNPYLTLMGATLKSTGNRGSLEGWSWAASHLGQHHLLNNPSIKRFPATSKCLYHGTSPSVLLLHPDHPVLRPLPPATCLFFHFHWCFPPKTSWNRIVLLAVPHFCPGFLPSVPGFNQFSPIFPMNSPSFGFSPWLFPRFSTVSPWISPSSRSSPSPPPRTPVPWAAAWRPWRSCWKCCREGRWAICRICEKEREMVGIPDIG